MNLEAWTALGSGESIGDTLLIIGEERTVLEAIADKYPEMGTVVERVLDEWDAYAARLRPYLH